MRQKTKYEEETPLSSEALNEIVKHILDNKLDSPDD